MRFGLPRLAAALVVATSLVACAEAFTPDHFPSEGTLRVHANVSGTPVDQLAVTVTGPGIPAPLVFNLTLSAGIASGTIVVPTGSGRVVTIRAFDAQGVETHRGSVTLTIVEGVNPTVSLTLAPLTGSVPIAASLGSTAIVVAPANHSVQLGQATALSASGVDPQGAAISEFRWASSNPSIASVDSLGVVTGHTLGTVTIAATALGVAARATVAVVPYPAPGVLTIVTQPDSVVGVDSSVVTLPTVRLRDANGNDVQGITVTFASTIGGGVLTGATRTTDASGLATLGGWTVGPTPTVNRLQVSAPGAPPVDVAVRARGVTRLALGPASACALRLDGQLFCWGDNSTWQFGGSNASLGLPASPTAWATPVASPAAPAITLARGTAQHVCAFQAASQVQCWGRGGFSQTGRGVADNFQNAPAALVGGHAWAEITRSRLSSCGVTTANVGYCWGSNNRGNVGNPSIAINASQAAPVAIAGGHAFTSVVTGWLHACGITTAGAAYCWGDNSSGQLGSGTPIDTAAVRSPVAVASGETWMQLTTGPRHTCGLTTGGRAYCWGFNHTGQLGEGTTVIRTAPTAVLMPPGVRFTAIAAGGSFDTTLPDGTVLTAPQAGPGHTCALTDTGVAYCWGWNAWGQLGNGTLVSSSTPVQVAGLQRFSAIAVGDAFTCAERGGVFRCWGSNRLGQLATGAIGAPNLHMAPFLVPAF